jgi:hypothetical protein
MVRTLFPHTLPGSHTHHHGALEEVLLLSCGGLHLLLCELSSTRLRSSRGTHEGGVMIRTWLVTQRLLGAWTYEQRGNDHHTMRCKSMLWHTFCEW